MVTISSIPLAIGTSDTASITPFANATLADPGGSTYYQLYVVQQTPDDGILRAPAAGLVSNDGLVYNLVADTLVSASQNLSELQAALRQLVFQPDVQEVAPGQSVSTGLSVEIEPQDNTLTVAAVTTVTTTAAPTPFAIEQPPPPVPFLLPGSSFPPFSGWQIVDGHAGAQDSAAITLTVGGTASDAAGTLSGTGLSKIGSGTYTLAAAAPATEQAELRTLQFTAASGVSSTTVGATVQVADGVADPVSTQTTFSLDVSPAVVTVLVPTTSSTTSYNDTPASQTAQAYSTTINAVVGATQVYNQTFALPFSDPAVQNAVSQADAAVAAAGATPGSPVLASSSSSSSSTTTTTPAGTTVGSEPVDSILEGAAPIYVVADGVGGQEYIYAAQTGAMGEAVNTQTQYINAQTVTTTTTTMLSQSYTITGTIPAVPQLASAGGTLTQTGPSAYLLDLGTVAPGAAATGTLTVGNAAPASADALDGSFAVTGNTVFANASFASFAGLSAGSTTTAGTISLNTSQVGGYSETLTFTPLDDKGAGSTAALPPITVTIRGAVAQAGAQGDVHMQTFDGLRYDFQATGDFTLAQSAGALHPFDVQIRTAAYGSLASIATKVAAQVGTDAIAFDLGGEVTVDGVADPALAGPGAVQAFAGGRVSHLASDGYQIDWDGGETLAITDRGFYFDLAMALGPGDGPGSVRGLLGSDGGWASDFTLPNGTVLAPPLSEAVLLGQFADAWRVRFSQSMLSGSWAPPAGAALLPSVVDPEPSPLPLVTPAGHLDAVAFAFSAIDPGSWLLDPSLLWGSNDADAYLVRNSVIRRGHSPSADGTDRL